jgi:hypothetical protein
VQAFEYEQTRVPLGHLENFFTNAAASYVFKTDIVRGWMSELLRQRDAAKARNQQSPTTL